MSADKNYEKHKSNRHSAESKGKKRKKIVHFECSVRFLKEKMLEYRSDDVAVYISKLAKEYSNEKGQSMKLQCRDDGLHFKNKGLLNQSKLRNTLRYENILQFVLVDKCVDLFIIVSASDRVNFCMYEAYRCKNTANLEKIQSCLKKISSKSKKSSSWWLEDSPTTNRRSLKSVNMSDSESIGATETLPTTEVLSEGEAEIISAEEDYVVIRQSAELSIKNKQKNFKTSSINYKDVEDDVEVVPINQNHSRVEETYGEMLTNTFSGIPLNMDEDTIKNTTFFEYDPVEGYKLNNEGPIFMYFQRYSHDKPTENFNEA